MRANEVNPDPNTAMVVCTSVMLGLMARKTTGEGQQIFMDMFGANAYANHDDFLNYPGKKPRALADDLMHGLNPTYRLYQCDNHEWVFLALVTDREKTRFLEILGKAGIDCSQLSSSEMAEEAAIIKLEALFKTRPASDWEELLAHKGIGCVRADGVTPSLFWLEDEQAESMNLTKKSTYLAWGA